MISTNIDGSSGGSNQMFDLLSLLSNPDSYKTRLEALQKAIAENGKLIALAGPAQEIIAIRDNLLLDREDMKVTLSDAKTQAALMKKTAADNAEAVVAEANEASANIIAEAKAIKATAVAEAAETNQVLKAAKSTQANADSLKLAGEARLVELNKELSGAEKTRLEVEDLKASIISKHQDFIASL
jgi:cell division septum initiation protein DivIVA